MSRTKVMMFAAVILVAGASSGAMAQYVCPPGYVFSAGVCQPASPPGYSNPVSGAIRGEAAGAAQGYAVGGPVGAVVGGALGTATGTISGTAGMLAPPAPTSACAPGYMLYNGSCYPAR
jgi:hypothetical protein